MPNVHNYLEYINAHAQPGTSGEFVLQCEQKYQNKLKNVAEKVNAKKGHQIILLAGPSSAGKTTTAKLIKQELEKFNREVFTISLDDYYKNSEDAILDEDGNPDFETIYALDLDLLSENLNGLVNNGAAEKPLFDFLTGKRQTKTERIEIDDDDIVVVEGLHALNPLVTSQLTSDNITKIFVNISSRIYNEENKIILNKRNIRFVRRMIRDFNFRNSSVENTLNMWRRVTLGEEKYLFPYQDTADIKINSLHLYEPCVFRDRAIELLGHVDASHEDFEYCRRLAKAMGKFESIDPSQIPQTSLLREFIGY